MTFHRTVAISAAWGDPLSGRSDDTISFGTTVYSCDHPFSTAFPIASRTATLTRYVPGADGAQTQDADSPSCATFSSFPSATRNASVRFHLPSHRRHLRRLRGTLVGGHRRDLQHWNHRVFLRPAALHRVPDRVPDRCSHTVRSRRHRGPDPRRRLAFLRHLLFLPVRNKECVRAFPHASLRFHLPSHRRHLRRLRGTLVGGHRRDLQHWNHRVFLRPAALHRVPDRVPDRCSHTVRSRRHRGPDPRRRLAFLRHLLFLPVRNKECVRAFPHASLRFHLPSHRRHLRRLRGT